jgi:hypothetical protein
MSSDSGRRALPWVARVLAAVLLIGGCEGSNLFEGEVAQESPEITSLSAPVSVNSAETFNVQVAARAQQGVRFIEVRVSGAATDSIRTEFAGTNQTESTSLNVTASSAFGSQVVIEAFVQDVNGLSSPTRRATVSVNPVSAGPAPAN